MGQSIVITSGKGGTGKSTLAVALARLLVAAGRSIALVDMDMGMRSLDLMLGVQDNVVYDLADVCEGTCRIKQALVRVEKTDAEFYLLNAAQTRGSDAIAPHQVEQVISRLSQRLDFVLIDSPAGVDRGFRNACAGADAAILVVVPDPVSLRDAERVVGLLQKCDIRDPLLLVNRVLPRAPEPGLSVDDMRERLRLQLLGWLPELPPKQVRALHNCPEMKLVARRLMGESIDVAPPVAPGLLARIFGR